ncbi:MAG: mycothiol-dependent nitroreductase Rv2466c family protein, partial [Acidimicrobiales bacterium]
MTTSSNADIEFFFDPICPFAWVTSRWVEKVVAQSDYDVEWRFISLRILNKAKDYDTEFPAGYEHGHTAGLRMLRVAAHVRDELGYKPLGALYTAFGDSYFSVDKADGKAARAALGTIEAVTACLTTAGLDTKYAAAVDDTSWDQIIEDETELALSRTGRDVGTPIITFQPPDGLSFFGPVISRVPADEDALPLWEAVTTLASYPGFAEMKRSMREAPQLNVLGGNSESPKMEDWK